MAALDIVRTFFGVVLVFFLPGLAWSFVFFTRRELEWIERIAVSFGLSTVIIPLAMFVLYLLFHLPITLLNTAIATSVLTAAPLCLLTIGRPSVRHNIVTKLKGLFARGTDK